VCQSYFHVRKLVLVFRVAPSGLPNQRAGCLSLARSRYAWRETTKWTLVVRHERILCCIKVVAISYAVNSTIHPVPTAHIKCKVNFNLSHVCSSYMLPRAHPAGGGGGLQSSNKQNL
jgi:hypothetical protein